MTRITYMRGDVQTESSEWLFKSPFAGDGGMLWRRVYRLHSLSSTENSSCCCQLSAYTLRLLI